MPQRAVLIALQCARRHSALLMLRARVLCMHQPCMPLNAMLESIALCPEALGTAHTKSNSAVHAPLCKPQRAMLKAPNGALRHSAGLLTQSLTAWHAHIRTCSLRSHTINICETTQATLHIACSRRVLQPGMPTQGLTACEATQATL